MGHEGDGNTDCNWCTQNDPMGWVERLEKLEIGGQAETIQTTALLRIL